MTMEMETRTQYYEHGDGTRTRYYEHGDGTRTRYLRPWRTQYCDHRDGTRTQYCDHGDGTRTRMVMTKGHLLTCSPTVQRCRQRALEINLFFLPSRKPKNKYHSRIMPNYSPPYLPKTIYSQLTFFSDSIFFWVGQYKKKDQIKGLSNFKRTAQCYTSCVQVCHIFGFLI